MCRKLDCYKPKTVLSRFAVLHEWLPALLVDSTMSLPSCSNNHSQNSGFCSTNNPNRELLRSWPFSSCVHDRFWEQAPSAIVFHASSKIDSLWIANRRSVLFCSLLEDFDIHERRHTCSNEAEDLHRLGLEARSKDYLQNAYFRSKFGLYRSFDSNTFRRTLL